MNYRPTQFNEFIRHVNNIEKSYWQKDDICDIEVAQGLIKLSENPETESDISDVEVKELCYVTS